MRLAFSIQARSKRRPTPVSRACHVFRGNGHVYVVKSTSSRVPSDIGGYVNPRYGRAPPPHVDFNSVAAGHRAHRLAKRHCRSATAEYKNRTTPHPGSESILVLRASVNLASSSGLSPFVCCRSCISAFLLLSPAMNKDKIVLGLCLASLSLTLFLAALDIVIVITLYDTISEKFHAYGSIGWLVTGYSLANALFTLLWGRLSALFGLKSCLSISILIFEIGSLVVALANSMSMLIAGRVVAGIGGSGIQSLVFVVGTSLVDERNRGLVITVLGMAFMVANAIGPILGGAFTQHATWRWCFYINLPVGGLAFAMLFFFYNPTEKPLAGSLTSKMAAIRRFNYGKLATGQFWADAYRMLFFKLDFVGFALSSTGFVLFLLGLTFGGDKYAWGSSTIIVYLVVGPVLLLLFLLYDFVVLPRLNNGETLPLLPWSSVAMLGVLTSSIANFFACIGFNMQTVYLIQFYQLVWNSSPTSASLHMWAFLVPCMAVIIAVGNINKRFGAIKPVAVVGVALGTVGSGLLTMQKGSTTLGQTIGYCILPGAAFAAMMQSSMLSAQVQVSKTDPQFRTKFIEVTALNAFAKSLGMAFGGIMATMIFSTSVKNQLADGQISLPQQITNVEALISYHAQHFDGRNSPLARIFTKGVQNVFYGSLGAYALSFVFSLVMSNKRLVVGPPKSANTDDHSSSTDIDQEHVVLAGESSGKETEEKQHDSSSLDSRVDPNPTIVIPDAP
ncbi:LADA_0B09472g1_1 [Lachancea dasiensis]|uniref:LADA_0B09472g1_1 n=1 Tax=Lachancea dasiensis TaxID=1072105 RepID=A0A1G4IV71_9SACH|nr:LADA_0B09472g1_1 [Lachancea dasiensis]